ncbi:hypothetical protein P43SY_002508 [Pythium insidiosum]|uniref:UDENN domain-containing protein n=1 Tax=Pythium insidiosum TaxID=114742 RepID=A0AAD5LQX0_PYTIN|nr:hypothetical protein P43SY_002508 [Pythium insidiosum]
MATTGRSRLVDYYVEVGVEPCEPCEESAFECLQRRILHREPAADHRDFPLPDGVPFFCIPECLSDSAASTPSAFERRPTFFSFSLTGGDGTRAYGFALHVFQEDAATAQWQPLVYCIISHHPFFTLFKELVSWIHRERSATTHESHVVDAILADASERRNWFLSPRGLPSQPLEAVLPLSLTRALSDGATPRSLHAARPQSPSKDDSAEVDTDDEEEEEEQELSPHERVARGIAQLVHHAVAPCAGGVLDVRDRGQRVFRYHLHRSNVAHLDDYCFQVLFQCLSLHNVVQIVNCMLLEQRILIHSNHPGLLAPVCEALCALLFPFTWEHVCVPFLPVRLIEYLQAPVPYLMGLHTSALTTRVGAEIFSSCVVVHLDKDRVVTPISVTRRDDLPVDFVLDRLPARDVDLLIRTLTPVVPQPVCAIRSASPSKHRELHCGRSHAIEELSECQEVELTFGEGPLGITFESTHMRLLAVSNFERGGKPGASAVIKSLPRLHNGLPGPAERSGRVRPGSFLIAINGQSTLDMSFTETIDRLRVEKRPVRLRFQNAELPHENASRFAERLQALSLVSALQVESANAASFCEAAALPGSSPNAYDVTGSSAATAPSFLREFTQTQCFAGFVNDSVMGRVSHTDAYPQIELFKHCVHLRHELGDDATSAIALLFERDLHAIETQEFELGETTHMPPAPTATSISASPAKRASVMRQLEMMICGAHPEDMTLPSECESSLLGTTLTVDVYDSVDTPSTVTTCRSLSSSGSMSSLAVEQDLEDVSSPVKRTTHDRVEVPEMDDELQVLVSQMLLS